MKKTNLILTAFAFALAISAAFAFKPAVVLGYSSLEDGSTCVGYSTQSTCDPNLSAGTICTIVVPGHGTQNAKRNSSCPAETLRRPS